MHAGDMGRTKFAGVAAVGNVLLLAVSAAAQMCTTTPPPESSTDFACHGKWLGPWIFHSTSATLAGNCIPGSQVCLSLDPCNEDNGGKAIAHAMLIPDGFEEGKVLLMDEAGRFVLWSESTPWWLDATVWCIPANRGPNSPAWGACQYTPFCAGHTTLPDGTFILAGGGKGIVDGAKGIVFFDPMVQMDGTVNPWKPGPEMAKARYYGTVMPMLKAFNGDPFILGGTEKTYQSSDPWAVREWLKLSSGVGPDLSCGPVTLGPVDWTQLTLYSSSVTEFEYYPRLHQLSDPSGVIFNAGDTHPGLVALNGAADNNPGDTWFMWPLPSTPTSSLMSDGPTDLEGSTPMNRYYGSSVLLHQLDANGGANRVLLFGGADGCSDPGSSYCDPAGVVTVRSTVKELVFASGTGTLVNKAPLLSKRVFSNAVILPTGEIFVSRGSSQNPHGYEPNDDPSEEHQPYLHGEIYDPQASHAVGTGASRYTAHIPTHFDPAYYCPPSPDAPTARVYHHIALLLPSGRVLVAGGDDVPLQAFPDTLQCGQWGTSSLSGEIFEPPYMHQGYTTQITSAPSGPLHYRNPFTLEFKITGSSPGAYIDRVVLIRTGSVTHHQDMSQAYVEMNNELTGPMAVLQGNPSVVLGTLSVTAPGPLFAPPGYYMLFVVAKDGTKRVPSAGKMIKLE